MVTALEKQYNLEKHESQITPGFSLSLGRGSGHGVVD